MGQFPDKTQTKPVAGGDAGFGDFGEQEPQIEDVEYTGTHPNEPTDFGTFTEPEPANEPEADFGDFTEPVVAPVELNENNLLSGFMTEFGTKPKVAEMKAEPEPALTE